MSDGTTSLQQRTSYMYIVPQVCVSILKFLAIGQCVYPISRSHAVCLLLIYGFSMDLIEMLHVRINQEGICQYASLFTTL